MHGRMTIILFLTLGSAISSGHVAADEADAQKDRVREACPGVAVWERGRATASTSEVNLPTASNPALRDKLVGMAHADQTSRNIPPEKLASEGAAALDGVNKVDAVNLRNLQEIVRVSGVPTLRTIGGKGMEAFWILVQHADRDPSLQEQVLSALSSDRQGLPLSEIALLTDRIQVNRGKPQVYGTQFHRENGQFVPDAIQEPGSLAERRRRMDLMPLSDYECVLQATYSHR